MRTATLILCACCAFMASAECGEEESCAAERDAAALLQGAVRVHSESDSSQAGVCWMRMPTGCNKALSETSTPTSWFKDPHSSNSATCTNRLGAFNNWCGRGDAVNHWGAASPQGSVKTIKGSACSGDDCTSKAYCPSGYKVISCDSEPPDSGDGIIPYTHVCVARGANSNKIAAVATCKKSSATSVVVSSSKYLDNQDVKASCSSGKTAIRCLCYSAWTSCKTTVFSPSGANCKQAIPKSAGHRRRGVGSGSGAKVYALCGSNADKASAPPIASPGSCGSRTTVEACDPNKRENPCSWTGSKCEVGCQSIKSKGSCEKQDHCKYRYAGYGMSNGWYCMGHYQEVYVGGDNGNYWSVGGKSTPREKYGSRQQMRPEYMTSESYNKKTKQWEQCGGESNCWYGYYQNSLKVVLTSSTYTKAATDITIKCTHREQIWVQVDPTNTKSHGPWNENAEVTIFYNLAKITPKWNKHWGMDEHRLTVQPSDKYPILRLEVKRKDEGKSATLQAKIVLNKALVVFDSCMDNKANHAQCLEELEKSDPDSKLRGDHKSQQNCLTGKDKSKSCKDWRGCLNDETEKMILTVNKAFGNANSAVQLVQEHVASSQNRTLGDPRCAKSQTPSDCKCGTHGLCVDPPSTDIESFDCSCLDNVRAMSATELHEHLCKHPLVCCDWKQAACKKPWSLLSTDVEMIQEKESGSATSLDESLSGKRSC